LGHTHLLALLRLTQALVHARCHRVLPQQLQHVQVALPLCEVHCCEAVVRRLEWVRAVSQQGACSVQLVVRRNKLQRCLAS